MAKGKHSSPSLLDDLMAESSEAEPLPRGSTAPAGNQRKFEVPTKVPVHIQAFRVYVVDAKERVIPGVHVLVNPGEDGSQPDDVSLNQQGAADVKWPTGLPTAQYILKVVVPDMSDEVPASKADAAGGVPQVRSRDSAPLRPKKREKA